MKKLMISIILGFLLIGGSAYAEEQQKIVNPESELYETVRLIEDNEYELTEEYGEKALLQDEYADRRLEEMEEVLENDNEEVAERLMEDYNQHTEEIDKNLKQGRELGDDISEVESLVAEKSLTRSKNLSALLEREDLPEEAKAGISKALENQEKAMERLSQALEKANKAREQAEEKANKVRGQAEEKASKAREQVEEKDGEARKQVEEKDSEARGQVEARDSEARDQVEARDSEARDQVEEKDSEVREQAEEREEGQEVEANQEQKQANTKPANRP